MSKRVTCEFKPPIPWKKIIGLNLGSVIYKTSGGSQEIESIRCDQKDFDKIASILKNKKIAFQTR